MALKLKKGSMGGIDMTPMIDVMFQLLIFFIVATKLDESEHELKVQLPSASEAKPLTSKPEELLVSIDKNGNFLINNRGVPLETLEQSLARASLDNPGRQLVRIRADQDAAHKFVVAVMNACNKAGITDYRIDTQKTE
ncbi:MAG: biopolymer transporter ExbD [Pirellulales bacterium]|nr:biopolymer transporter ExbD [Pirellulales bacterium]